MKYRKLFFLSLPLSLLGLKKIISHHHNLCGRHSQHPGRWHHHGHAMKLVAWRLGLSPEQRGQLDELYNKIKTEGKPFCEKKSEIRNMLTREFRKEQFETNQLGKQITPETLSDAHDLFLKSIGEFHDILTPLQRDKVASRFERHHC